MKTTLKILAVLVLVLVAFNPYPAAGETFVLKYRGKGVNAYFLSMDVTGCIRTSVYLTGAEEALRTAPGEQDKTAGVYFSLYQYNDCTETRLAQASGFTELSRSDFRVGGPLDSAHLNTTVTMQDWYSSRTFDVSVDLDWNSTTDVYHHIFRMESSYGGCQEKIQTKEDFRYAQASGTILDGSTNLVPEPSYQASIFSAKEGQLAHGCE